MPIRFLLWFSWFWMGGTLLAGIAIFDTNSLLDPAQNPDINSTLLIGQIDIKKFDLVFFDFPVPVPSVGIIGAMGNILTWNYPFFTNGWEYFRFFILLPITFVATWIILTVLGPIFLQAIAVIRNLARI